MTNLLALTNHRMEDIEILGEVSAGHNVVPFYPQGKKRILKLPLSAHTQPSETKAIKVVGDSLNQLNVNDGDDLVFSTQFFINEITPDKVCVVYIHSTGELIARKVIFNENGTVTLRAANPSYSDKIYEQDEVEIRGLVFKCVFNLTLAVNFLIVLIGF